MLGIAPEREQNLKQQQQHVNDRKDRSKKDLPDSVIALRSTEFKRTHDGSVTGKGTAKEPSEQLANTHTRRLREGMTFGNLKMNESISKQFKSHGIEYIIQR